MAERSKTFEASMERLEAIVRQLEQGNVPLEESLKLFQEGTETRAGLHKAAGQGGAGGCEADERAGRGTGGAGVRAR